jgi:PAS domain S-box-containing protein
MEADNREDHLLRNVALQNANSIFAARQRAEQELLSAKDALEQKSQELARSLSMMRATLESTTDGILVTDEHADVTDCNASFMKIWGFPADAMATRRHSVLIDLASSQFSEPESFRARVAEIYASAPPETYDLLELKDGRVLERYSRIQQADGQSLARVWSFRDITERRRAEEARFRLAAIVESSDDAIVSKTLEGVITSWNNAAERMFGYPAAEAVGKHITILIPPDRLHEERIILDRIRRGARVGQYETIRMRKDGSQFDVALTVSPVKDASGKIIGASKIARDITDRKLAAKEREELLDAERAARTEAERVSLMKDEFLANISHELRTPLNAILGWAQLLASGKASAEDMAQGLDTIGRNARLQATLIEDLLDMSRIVSGKVRLDVQQTDLGSVVELAVSAVRPSAEAKGIHLRKIIDPLIGPVTGDPNRLQQVVWNLLANAVKFTPKGGSVEVLVQRVNSHLEVTVHDSGMGIGPEFLPYVFERFRQGDSSITRVHGGLGLGLSIVKHLVELHGGSVRAHSAGTDRGATFVVSLPLAPVRSDARREHPTTPSRPIREFDDIDLSGVKVLVLEDEPDARELIKRVLVQYQAEVSTAGSGAQALEMIKTEKPDVLVSDIGMPEMDGYRFIRMVRQLPPFEGGSVPAVALTAFARSEDRTRAMIAGYQVHISKPIEPQELVATVASLAGRTMRSKGAPESGSS